MNQVKTVLAVLLCAIMLTDSMQAAYATEVNQEENPDEYVLVTGQMQSDGSEAAARHSIMCHARLEPLNDYTIHMAPL